jgi:transcriptional regulator GlxA family with amidase domain
MTIRLHVAILPGVLDSALGTVMDIAHAANRLLSEAGRRPAFDIVPVGPSAGTVPLSSGLRLTGVGRLGPCTKREIVVMPGANQATAGEVLGWLDTRPARSAVAWLGDANAAGSRIYAGCTGTFIAAEAGALNGHRATTTWWLAPTFGDRYPDVRLDLTRVLVQSGSLTTAGAAFAHADLMLALVEQEVSVELARLCARYLLLDARRVRSSYPLLGRLAREDSFAARAERWVADHLAEPFTAADWAEALHTSSRTLARRLQAKTGMTPLQFVQRARVERAVHLLESTRAPIDTIASQVGYTDATALRRLIRRELGTNPKDVRLRLSPKA